MTTIRLATPADADGIARVHVRAWQSAYAGIVPAETLAALDPDEDARRTRQALADETRPFRTLVAVDGAGVIGFASYGPYRNNQSRDDLDPAVGEIPAFYVDPERQGEGAGRRLLTAAMDALRERGLPEVRLWVLEANAAARGFYERCGLAPDGERMAFRAGDVELPEVRYAVRLG
jgi:ribosomal protein S18 acetylase RimI-like enzyme